MVRFYSLVVKTPKILSYCNIDNFPSNLYRVSPTQRPYQPSTASSAQHSICGFVMIIPLKLRVFHAESNCFDSFIHMTKHLSFFTAFDSSNHSSHNSSNDCLHDGFHDGSYHSSHDSSNDCLHDSSPMIAPTTAPTTAPP